jgi:flavin-dependent dehydrogenase
LPFIDPVTGSGVLNAMLNGKLAGIATARCKIPGTQTS